jgi:hypothetical protein
VTAVGCQNKQQLISAGLLAGVSAVRVTPGYNINLFKEEGCVGKDSLMLLTSDTPCLEDTPTNAQNNFNDAVAVASFQVQRIIIGVQKVTFCAFFSE